MSQVTEDKKIHGKIEIQLFGHGGSTFAAGDPVDMDSPENKELIEMIHDFLFRYIEWYDSRRSSDEND